MNKKAVMNVKNINKILKSSKELLVIPHWDSDGLSSAAMLALKFNSAKAFFKIPPIGEYWISKDFLEELHEITYDTVVILDWAIPFSEIKKLHKICNHIIIIDHHYNVIPAKNENNVYTLNPKIDGSEKYCSTTFVIWKYLNAKFPKLMLLGLIGDYGSLLINIKDHIPELKEYLANDFNYLKEIISLIDSNYKLLNRKGVLKTLHKLLECPETLECIANDKKLVEQKKKLDKLINDILTKNIVYKDFFIIKIINTKAYVISDISRILAWKNPEKIVIVTNYGYSEKNAQIYVRLANKKINLKPLLSMLKREAVSIGGKDEVVGVIVNKKNVDHIVKRIISIIKNYKME